MKLKLGSILSSHYNVIDNITGNKLKEIFFVDDKIGIYKTYELSNPGKCIGLKINVDEYIEFTKRHFIKLEGKNILFKFIKKVLDLLGE